MNKDTIILLDHNVGFKIYHEIRTQLPDLFLRALFYTNTPPLDHYWPTLINIPGIGVYSKSALKAALDHWNIRFLFLISWKFILPDWACKGVATAINLHYSPLPAYRGVYPVNWQIFNGESSTCVTYHVVINKIDAGPIVHQSSKIPIEPSDTTSDLLSKMDDIATDSFSFLWKNLESLINSSRPQDSGGSYYSKKDYDQILKSGPPLSNEDLRLRYERAFTFNQKRLWLTQAGKLNA